MTTQVIEAMPNFKFGADPELFIINGEGEYVSAEGLIPGTKSDPYPVECGAIQVDGMAAEFNIHPATSFEEFDNNIVTVVRELKKHLPKGYKLVAKPAVEFSQEVWDSSPYHAKELGCSPDYNAWTGSVNPPPQYKSKPTLRTAAGHLHIGWRDDGEPTELRHVGHCRALVQQLDWYLGAWSVAKDPDPTRRLLYGKAGACRFKPYGVEYRVLSNFWVTEKALRRDVWNRMNQAIWDMRDNCQPEKRFNFNDTIIKSIDNSVPIHRSSYLGMTHPFRFKL